MLDLASIEAGYGGVQVLRSVSLHVPDASVVVLLGANGAGKTTLLKVASGLLRPDAGTAQFAGLDIVRTPTHRLAEQGLCHVPEGRGIFPSLTVRENLHLFCRKGEEAVGVERAVSAFPKLGQLLNRVAGTMSGGEQQMLALARTYVRPPRLVLLDEVSMGLAPKILDEIFAFLRRLASEGTSLLLVEQYATRALAVGDYAYVLSRGAVVYQGQAADLSGEDVFARYLSS